MLMAATHQPAFTMVDGHNNSYTVEGHLPRANTLAHSALSMTGFMEGQVTSAFGNLFFHVPGQSGSALASALLIVWELWCSPVSFSSRLTPISLQFVEEIPGNLLFHVPGQSGSALASALLIVWELWCSPVSFSSRLTPISLHPHCIVIYSLAIMTRKRGRPRRGSAWYTHKAQRQRKEKLERALAMATSILRKKARAEKLALHAIIAETGAGCSSETTTIKPGDRQEDGVADAFPTCYVEEIPFMEDLTTTPEPQAMEATHRDGSGPKIALADDIPGCIVEEIPWPGDYSPTSHDMQATFEEETRDKTRAEVNADNNSSARKEEVDGAELMELEAGIGATVELRDVSLNDVGNGLHGSLLRAEHLALVFELRGHMADLEHRALLMGQRLDLLLDAYSNAPAKRKCPLCAQAFAIPAGSTWQTSKGDRSPGI
jgi:hypothetical protein